MLKTGSWKTIFLSGWFSYNYLLTCKFTFLGQCICKRNHKPMYGCGYMCTVSPHFSWIPYLRICLSLRFSPNPSIDILCFHAHLQACQSNKN